MKDQSFSKIGVALWYVIFADIFTLVFNINPFAGLLTVGCGLALGVLAGVHANRIKKRKQAGSDWQL